MKKIRFGVFETNSSSTHSISIVPEGWNKKKYIDRIDNSPYYESNGTWISQPMDSDCGKMKVCRIKTHNYYKRDDNCFLMDTDLQKINCLVSNVMPHLSPFNLKANEKNIIVINSVMDAVKAYMKDKYDIMYFEVDSKDVDHITDIIWDLCDFSGDLSKEDIYNIIYNIISNDDIIFTYHSDECDIMEDFGVQQIFRLQDLKSPGMSSDDIRKAIIAGDIEEEKEFEKNNWIDNLIENT